MIGTYILVTSIQYSSLHPVLYSYCNRRGRITWTHDRTRAWHDNLYDTASLPHPLPPPLDGTIVAMLCTYPDRPWNSNNQTLWSWTLLSWTLQVHPVYHRFMDLTSTQTSLGHSLRYVCARKPTNPLANMLAYSRGGVTEAAPGKKERRHCSSSVHCASVYTFHPCPTPIAPAVLRLPPWTLPCDLLGTDASRSQPKHWKPRQHQRLSVRHP